MGGRSAPAGRPTSGGLHPQGHNEVEDVARSVTLRAAEAGLKGSDAHPAPASAGLIMPSRSDVDQRQSRSRQADRNGASRRDAEERLG